MPKDKGAKRDPNKPKKPLTAFMCFSMVRRPQIKEETPELSFTEIGKKLGEDWRALSDEQKVPYLERHAEDKARYEEEKANYVPDPRYDKKSKRKDPNKPKRAMSAYLYFCNAHRESVKSEFPEKTMTAVQKILAERWKSTSEEDRIPYTKQADADRQRYDNEVLQRSKVAGGVMYEDDEEEEDESE